MKVTIGEIEHDQQLAFLKEKDFVTVKQVAGEKEIEQLKDEYYKWCEENDIVPFPQHRFFFKLYDIGVITCKDFVAMYGSKPSRV